MKHITLMLSLCIGITLQAQIATVEIYRQTSDSLLQATITWNNFKITYQEFDHYSFITKDNDEADSSKKTSKLKNSYQMMAYEKFTVDLDGRSGSPNSIFRAVNQSYSEMMNEESLLKMIPENIELSPDLFKTRGWAKAESTLSASWNHGKCGVGISEKGPSARAIMEDVIYQGYPFDSIPYDTPFQKIRLSQSKIFNALSDPDSFKYVDIDRSCFEVMRKISFEGMKFKKPQP